MQDNLISSKIFGANFQVVRASKRICSDDLESGFGFTGCCWGKKTAVRNSFFPPLGLFEHFSTALYILLLLNTALLTRGT